MTAFDPCEASINSITDALRANRTTSLALVEYYLKRMEQFDSSGAHLNAVPVLNSAARDEAIASDERRARGETLGPLDGIPYTVKDSYRVAGMTVAAGSPAFAKLRASQDSFAIEQLRRAGAVLLGRTNMPPMADGGMQRGLHGRAESPYNPNFLAAAFASGSSQGSGVAVASNFGAFSLGSETVSSGRSPASNNSVVTYTPSRGVISMRGVWPLFALRDVVTPYTKTVADLCQLLDPLTQVDPTPRGDFWLDQPFVELPVPLERAPSSWAALPEQPTSGALAGKRIAVPRVYVGEGESMDIETRASILELWERAGRRLRDLGAEVVLTDFPVIEKYEGGVPAGENIEDLGVLPPGWMHYEFTDLLAFGWDDFLVANGDPSCASLADADPDQIFPPPPGSLPDRYAEVEDYDQRYRVTVGLAKSGIAPPHTRPDYADGLRALEQLREQLWESWMNDNGYDLVAFPANADVGPADADTNVESADIAWRNGVLFSNGNYAIRHLGIPTLTVPMGVMSDIGMPVGLTFAARAYDDRALIEAGLAFEAPGSLRQAPSLA
ncbi:MAG: amidase [Microbacteriaceae bacterium]